MVGRATTAIVLFSCLLHAQTPPLRVAPEIQQRRLLYHVRPVYPKLARQARIQGTVRLAALIDENGTVAKLRLLSGHPLLIKASFDAVKQWRYWPAMYRGVPVAVVTIISITFAFKPGGMPSFEEPRARQEWV